MGHETERVKACIYFFYSNWIVNQKQNQRTGLFWYFSKDYLEAEGKRTDIYKNIVRKMNSTPAKL